MAFKLDKMRFSKEIGRIWCSNKVVGVWNRLTLSDSECQDISLFKRRLDSLIDRDDWWERKRVLDTQNSCPASAGCGPQHQWADVTAPWSYPV